MVIAYAWNLKKEEEEEEEEEEEKKERNMHKLGINKFIIKQFRLVKSQKASHPCGVSI